MSSFIRPKTTTDMTIGQKNPHEQFQASTREFYKTFSLDITPV